MSNINFTKIDIFYHKIYKYSKNPKRYSVSFLSSTHKDQITLIMGCTSSNEIASNANISKLEAQIDQQDTKSINELAQLDQLMRVSIIADDAVIPPDSSVDHIILDIISNWDWENEYSSNNEYSSDEQSGNDC